jgi:hypothetical protein
VVTGENSMKTIVLKYSETEVHHFCCDILESAVIDCQYWAGHDLPKYAAKDDQGRTVSINFQHLVQDESLGPWKRTFLDTEALWQGLKEYISVNQSNLDNHITQGILMLNINALDDFDIDELIRSALFDLTLEW